MFTSYLLVIVGVVAASLLGRQLRLMRSVPPADALKVLRFQHNLHLNWQDGDEDTSVRIRMDKP